MHRYMISSSMWFFLLVTGLLMRASIWLLYITAFILLLCSRNRHLPRSDHPELLFDGKRT